MDLMNIILEIDHTWRVMNKVIVHLISGLQKGGLSDRLFCYIALMKAS